MNSELEEGLNRTLLLMRDAVVEQAPNKLLVDALIGTEIALIADHKNLTSHSAQCAYVTAALLMARSGHRVYLAAPDIDLIGPQPPLRSGRLLSSLQEVGVDLLPGVEFREGVPKNIIDLSVSFGDSGLAVPARRAIQVNADDWAGQLGLLSESRHWNGGNWPFGALAAGTLVAAEAFKASLQYLKDFAIDEALFAELFGFSERVNLALAPQGTSQYAELGDFDFISGGAITNSALYSLLRLPGSTGRGRIVEPENPDLSNLNRYPLLLRSHLGGISKADLLARQCEPHIHCSAERERYDAQTRGRISLRSSVLVGVDHIPTRWMVQEVRPLWLGIGATTHWAAMASFHEPGLACAKCLHPIDDPEPGRIPTVAFVSFFAGLILAAYFVQSKTRGVLPIKEQYMYATPLRPERVWRSPVAPRPHCPLCATNNVRAA